MIWFVTLRAAILFFFLLFSANNSKVRGVAAVGRHIRGIEFLKFKARTFHKTTTPEYHEDFKVDYEGKDRQYHKKFFPYRLEPYFICYEANRSLNSKVQWRNKTHTFSRYQSNRLSVRSSVHTPQQQIITLIMLVVFLWGIDRLIALGYCCWINLSLGDIIFCGVGEWLNTCPLFVCARLIQFILFGSLFS